MKFLADMGISPRTVAWLCRQGHDACASMPEEDRIRVRAVPIEIE